MLLNKSYSTVLELPFLYFIENKDKIPISLNQERYRQNIIIKNLRNLSFPLIQH